MANWKFPVNYPDTLAHVESPDYSEYIRAFGTDHLAAKAALIRLLEGPTLVDAHEHRAFFLRALAGVLVSLGDRKAAVKRLQEAALASPGSPFAKFYEGSFYIDRLDRPDRALEIAKEALELLGSPERGSGEQDLMAWIIALKGRCENDLGFRNEAHLSLCRLIALREEDEVVTDCHALELCKGLLRYEESRRDAKIYLGSILEASRRQGDPDVRPLRQEIEKLLSEA